MTNLTTIAALPMGAGCLSRLDPEVGKSPERPKRAAIYGWWNTGFPDAQPNAMALASLGYKVNAQGTIERL